MPNKRIPTLVDAYRVSKILTSARLNSNSDEQRFFGYKVFERELEKLSFDELLVSFDSMESGKIHKRYQETANDMQERECRLRWVISELKKFIPAENIKYVRQIEERALFPHREEAFHEAVQLTFGDPPVKGWQAVVCEACGITPHELRQWLSGRKEIPEWAIDRVNAMPYVSAETAKKKATRKRSPSAITASIVAYFERGGSKRQKELAAELGIPRTAVSDVFDNGPEPPSPVGQGDDNMSRYELWTVASFLFGTQWTGRLATLVGIKQHTLNVDYFFTYGERAPRQIPPEYRRLLREAYVAKSQGEEWESMLSDMAKRVA